MESIEERLLALFERHFGIAGGQILREFLAGANVENLRRLSRAQSQIIVDEIIASVFSQIFSIRKCQQIRSELHSIFGLPTAKHSEEVRFS